MEHQPEPASRSGRSPAARAQQAAALASLGDLERAEDAYRSLLHDHPGSAAAASGLAKIAHQRKEWTEAYRLWSECLQKFPGHQANAHWRRQQAHAALQAGFYDAAESLYSSLAEEFPDHRVGPAGVARVSEIRGRWPETAANFGLCLKRFPDDPAAPSWQSARAHALEHQGLWQEAFDAWNVLCEKGGSNLAAIHGRLRCVMKLKGPFPEAEQLAFDALKQFPDHPRLLNLYAELALLRGELEIARTRFERAMERHPDNLALYFGAIDAAIRLEDHIFAEAIIAAASADLRGTTAFRCRVMLLFYLMKGQVEAGLEIISGLNIGEVDQMCLAAIRRFLNYANRFEEMFTISAMVRELRPDNPLVLAIYLESIYFLRGEREFQTEKERWLSSLSAQQSIQVLNQIRVEFLSVLETKRIIDFHLASKLPGNAKVRRLYYLIRRGESEIMTYLAERLRENGSAQDRILAEVLLSAINDRGMIEAADISGFSWSDFKATSDNLRNSISQLVGQSEELPAPLDEVIPALDQISRECAKVWTNTAASYWEAGSFAAWLIDRIRQGQPTSVVRLGDGEGHFLPYAAQDAACQDADQRDVQLRWWGAPHLEGSAARGISDQFIESLYHADAIAITPAQRLISDMGPSWPQGVRAIRAIGKFMLSLPSEKLHATVLLGTNVNVELHQWDLYRQILAAASSVSVIASHDLTKFLAEEFGLKVRAWHPIPTHFRYKGLFDETSRAISDPFYPIVFERLMAEVAPLPGELFLVGAGFLGKLLCAQIRARGGIALDIGSLADLWLGRITRGQTNSGLDFDISSSLIKEQPFRDYFDLRGISGREPCRSDRRRHHNLTGEFDELFSDQAPLAAPGTYPLRIIGHPRCGSTYTTHALGELGLDIRHEQPGTDGLCSWIHSVDDLHPPFGRPGVPAAAFRVTLAYVRDPAAALPSIMLNNWTSESFSFRRFHIARQLGIDIAARRDPLERAVESYLCWMQIVERQGPLVTLRVEHLIDDLAAHDAALAMAGIRLDWSGAERARALPSNINGSERKFTTPKPRIPAARYNALPAGLAAGLAEFCAFYGYPWPGTPG